MPWRQFIDRMAHTRDSVSMIIGIGRVGRMRGIDVTFSMWILSVGSGGFEEFVIDVVGN